MPTFYLDYDGGNNANDGTTFANRWKDLTNGATAARIAPGDVIRIKESPPATSLGVTCVWTDGPLPSTVVPTSSTNATPIVFTKAGHGLVTGDTIIVNGHTTNTNANGVWDVTVSGDTFTLLNADGSNSIGNGVGGATGTFRKITNCRVKLASALTANIASYGNQGASSSAAWTASANVTTSVLTTDFKEGGGCQQIAIAAGFTTGLAAYFPTLTTLDLSGYQQLSFWIKQTVGTIGAAASVDIRLCSDTAGVTAVNTFNIPLLGALARWSPITVDLATNLGSSIQSIAFYVNTDNAAQTFLLDNIIACKASSSADSLSNVSLIGKNTGTEGWFGLQSINGTRLMLDIDTNCFPGTSPQRGYSGTTETVTTYKQESTKTDMVATLTTQVQSVMDSGTLGNVITFSGGWNSSDMTTQSGETIFDGQNGHGYGIYATAKSFCNLEKLSMFRYSNGLHLTGTSNNIFSSQTVGNNTTNGANLASSDANNNITIDNAVNNGGNGAQLDSNASNNKINLVNCSNNLTYGFHLSRNNSNNSVTITNVKNNGSTGVAILSSGNNLNITNSAGNRTSGFIVWGTAFLKGCTISDTVKATTTLLFSNATLWSTNENNDTNTHFGYTDGGLISSETSIRYTASGIAWKLAPTSTNRSSNYPLPLKVATVAVEANVAKTVSVRMRRTNTGLTARLICYADQLSGVSTTSTDMTFAQDLWEPVSVTVTATQKGVLEFYAECWGGTTYSLYVDDVTFS